MKMNKKLLLFNLIPLILSIAFGFVWFADRTSNRMIVNYLSWIQIICDWFVFPLYLIFLNGVYHKKNKKYLFFDKIIFMILNQLLINEIHYYSWSLSSALINQPDPRSIYIHTAGWQLPLYLILTGGAIIQIVLMIEYFIDKSE